MPGLGGKNSSVNRIKNDIYQYMRFIFYSGDTLKATFLIATISPSAQAVMLALQAYPSRILTKITCQL
jgi:hypothetical protein